MLKCYNAYLHFARWPIQHSQILKILNCTLPFSHLHFFIANLTSLHYFMGFPKFSDHPLPPTPHPQKNPLIAQLFLRVFKDSEIILIRVSSLKYNELISLLRSHNGIV